MAKLAESTVEQATLAWLQSLGWAVRHGPDIAPDQPKAERVDYTQVVLEQRLRDALARLNPSLPTEALDDAFRRVTHPGGATLESRNRALHRMLVDGVTVEYRRPGGGIAGAQARAAVARGRTGSVLHKVAFRRGRESGLARATDDVHEPQRAGGASTVQRSRYGPSRVAGDRR